MVDGFRPQPVQNLQRQKCMICPFFSGRGAKNLGIRKLFPTRKRIFLAFLSSVDYIFTIGLNNASVG
jgi:hypothetical protein